MSDGEDGWMSVVNKKKERRAKQGTRKYMPEKVAYKLQHDLDITGLASVLLSTESRNLQEDDWVFDRVLKNDTETDPEDEPSNTGEVEFMCLPIPNKWNDRALFSRRIVIARESN